MKTKPENHKVVVVLPGGGLKGALQSGILITIEEWLGGLLGDVVDLAIGTSVGSFTTTCIAHKVPMQTEQAMIVNGAPTYFTKSLLKRAKNMYMHSGLYDYRLILGDLRDLVGDLEYGDIPTGVKSIITADCRNDNKTHYFKSHDPKDASRRLLDVVSYAYAAPWYFGARNSPTENRTYIDAGTGTENNPVRTALFEIDRLGWAEQGTVSVVIVGTGAVDIAVPYSTTSKEGLIDQLRYSIRFASNESDGVNTKDAEFEARLLKTVSVTYLNPTIPAEMDVLDGVDFVPDYVSIAKEYSKSIDIGAAFGF